MSQEYYSAVGQQLIDVAARAIGEKRRVFLSMPGVGDRVQVKSLGRLNETVRLVTHKGHYMLGVHSLATQAVFLFPDSTDEDEGDPMGFGVPTRA